MNLFSDLIRENIAKLKDLSYFCSVLHNSMAKKENKEIQKNDDKREFITSEELRNKKLQISIEIPKKDLDELLKAMMGMGEVNRDNSK